MQVVRDHEQADPAFALQLQQQVEDLRLHGDVERRGRLVADHELGIERERACDAVALRSGAWDGCKVNAETRGRVVERSPDGLVTATRFELPEFQTWGRVEVEAPDGGRAWSGVVVDSSAG